MSSMKNSPVVDKKSLYRHARDTFGNPKKTHSWLETPNSALKGMKPKDFIESGIEEDWLLVEEELDRIDQGLF